MIEFGFNAVLALFQSFYGSSKVKEITPFKAGAMHFLKLFMYMQLRYFDTCSQQFLTLHQNMFVFQTFLLNRNAQVEVNVGRAWNALNDTAFKTIAP